ncbi:trehalose-phosphatase [Phenylobacterium aquaticum]|uniref:trehalose-phosphatase n=1 Tax=Phenylobacterium aquaticum TaxID=1763816 RepID=UPI0026F2390B|nr:trehalose-phosphatase [Phenylobacterium aquaticum]
MITDTMTLTAPAPRLSAAGTALFLDLDGTLAPIVARPEAVGPDPRRTRLLETLGRRLGGRLAVVSGRALPDLDRILEGRVPALAGVHGLVRRDAAGRVVSTPPHPGLVAARRVLTAFAASHAGLLVEDKGLSLALHYRLAPGLAPRARIQADWLAAETGLVLQPGDHVVELRTPGPRKGEAVAAFMAAPPFAGATPVFLGDDLTDEDAFVAVAQLGGFGVLVGAERATAARYRLDDVDAALDWLEALA